MSRTETQSPWPGHRGASPGQALGPWVSQVLDPEDLWAADAATIAARSADLARNDGLFAALRNTWVAGVVGPHGMAWRSLYQADDEDATDESERAARRTIEAWRRPYIAGQAWDAQGLRSWRDMQATCIDSRALYGESIVLRTLRRQPSALYPRRTCARIIHPLRVSTPPGGVPKALQAGHEITNGIEHNADGDPVAMWISAAHPGRMDPQGRKHVRVPLRDAMGLPAISWSAWRTSPEAVRGTGWAAPVLLLMRQLSGITESHVIAKRLQACMGLIIEVPDPVKAAAADRNGEVYTANTRFFPGKNYYVRQGTRITPFQFNYQGQDYSAFWEAMARQISAGFGPGLPWQFVLKQLTNSNMASSRTALMQAYHSFMFEGHALETDHLATWNLWQMDEGISTGALTLPTGDDLLRACAGHWQPPPRLAPDPLREVRALSLAGGHGLSESTILDELGYNYDQQIRQKSEDHRLADEQGVPLTGQGESAPDPDHETDDPAPADQSTTAAAQG
jgi:lambda family phage portal protein